MLSSSIDFGQCLINVRGFSDSRQEAKLVSTIVSPIPDLIVEILLILKFKRRVERARGTKINWNWGNETQEEQ